MLSGPRLGVKRSKHWPHHSAVTGFSPPHFGHRFVSAIGCDATDTTAAGRSSYW